MSMVVTADDLGLSPAVTRGILEAHRKGIVRSASLVVTFDASAEGAALARREPDLEVGLHIDLVGGMPASEPSVVPSLIDADGRFWPLSEFARRVVTGRIRAAELASEIRAQVARARGWGIAPLAWDSHRHTHLMPPVAGVVGRVARDEGVRWIRRARSPRSWTGPKEAALRAATMASALAYRGIAGPTWYIDLSSERPRLDAAGVALLATYGGIGELGSHPGYLDHALGPDDRRLERERDLRLLTDPLLHTALGDETVRWRVL
jgi:predicted glycoside hydrolase/deacetylase ChbG (UPF0249 family)